MSRCYHERTTILLFSAGKTAIATAILLSASSSVYSLETAFQHNKQAGVQLSGYGHLTDYGSALVTYMSQPGDQANRSGGLDNRIIYINAGEPLAEGVLEEIRHAMVKGAIILLDGTENSDNTSELSASIGGIGFHSPVLMLRHEANQGLEYKSLSFFNPEEATTALPEYPQEKHQRMASETSIMLTPWMTRKHRKSASENSRHPVNMYRPESTINVEIRHTGFPCMVGNDYQGNSVTGVSRWSGGMVDACDGNASVSLFYALDFIRSVSTQEGDTEDAKYLRITLNPGGDGGAGWHFVEKPRHKTLWFQSQTNRIEWFGPIVEDYTITLASQDPTIRLFQAVPGNKPKNSKIAILPSIGFGVSLPVGIAASAPVRPVIAHGSAKPCPYCPPILPPPAIDPTLALPVSVSDVTGRTVSYKNYEYTIINRSNDGATATASWLWSREFDKYSDGWRTNSICSLWCSDPFFDDNAFTPAAYAHFSPGFSATFRAPAEKIDQSSIHLTGAAKVVALGGRVQYKFLLQHYAPWDSKGSTYSFGQYLTVNWGSTLFNPEIPVSIEAFREDSEGGLCLNITENNAGNKVEKVDLQRCHFKTNQIWGMDTENRYKSLLAQDRCLTAEEDSTVTVQQCAYSPNQKWEWQQGQLANKLGGRLTVSADGSVRVGSIDSDAIQWRSFPRKPEQSDLLTIHSIPISQTQ